MSCDRDLTLTGIGSCPRIGIGRYQNAEGTASQTSNPPVFNEFLRSVKTTKRCRPSNSRKPLLRLHQSQPTRPMAFKLPIPQQLPMLLSRQREAALVPSPIGYFSFFSSSFPTISNHKSAAVNGRFSSLRLSPHSRFSWHSGLPYRVLRIESTTKPNSLTEESNTT